MPKYQWGQRVQARTDLFNDGTYPEIPQDALLVNTGDSGEIVNVGNHVEFNVPVYLVQFPRDRVVGCLEEELAPV
jgi:nitrogen fixation protein NifZ